MILPPPSLNSPSLSHQYSTHLVCLYTSLFPPPLLYSTSPSIILSPLSVNITFSPLHFTASPLGHHYCSPLNYSYITTYPPFFFLHLSSLAPLHYTLYTLTWQIYLFNTSQTIAINSFASFASTSHTLLREDGGRGEAGFL